MKRSSSANWAGRLAMVSFLSGRSRDADRGRDGLALLVVVDELLGGVVEVAQRDLLVVQRERVDEARLDHRLGGLEGVAVLERVILEGDDRELLLQALVGVLRRDRKSVV